MEEGGSCGRRRNLYSLAGSRDGALARPRQTHNKLDRARPEEDATVACEIMAAGPLLEKSGASGTILFFTYDFYNPLIGRAR